MSQLAIKLDGEVSHAAVEGGPYLVISEETVRGFRSYGDAEAFAGKQESMTTAPVTLARALFRDDERTPFRIKTFPTTHADCSFERARREFGL